LGPLVTLVKWLVYVALAVVGIYVLLKFLPNLPALLSKLGSLWQALWGKLLAGRSGQAHAVPAGGTGGSEGRGSVPFAAFTNPFLNGLSARCSADALVRYSFDALQAWARERGMGRHERETPLEFAERLGEQVPSLENEAERLALLYAGITYAQETLTADCLPSLKRLWQRLTPPLAEPMRSARD
jgi:hypothetical protein